MRQLLGSVSALALLTAFGCSSGCSSSPSSEGSGGSAGASAGSNVGGGNSGTAGASAGTANVSGSAGSNTTGGTPSGAGSGGTSGSAGASGSGGTMPGGGAGSGGTTAGTGGQPQAGAGGGAQRGFTCPPGSETMAPTIPANAGMPVANVPPAGYDPDNLEGPVWINGYLYLSEIGRFPNGPRTNPQPGRIIRYRPGGAAELFLNDVGTNGLAVNADGDLVAASQKAGAIVSFDLALATPSPTPKRTYASMYDSTRFSSPNDLAIRRDGNIYFTDPAYQAGSVRQTAERSYRIDPAGMVSVITNGPSPPNGITLSKNENTLYIGGSTLMAFPVMADGSLGQGAPFGNRSGTDGLGLDCAGNLYVTLHGEGRVSVLSPTGTELGSIMVGSGVTNVAFGGTDSKTLFITKLNPPSLYAVNIGIAGYPY